MDDIKKETETPELMEEDLAPDNAVADAAGGSADADKEPVKKKKPAKASSKTEELQKDLSLMKEQLADAEDQYKRLLAEYANYKRRSEQEKDQLGAFVKGETLKALLPAIDSLERAAAAPDGDNYNTGVVNTVRQLTDLLTAQGLEAIDPLGAPFDPERHNAVSREDAADGVEPETVTEVYQKGYQIAGRVLRPAMVKVAN